MKRSLSETQLQNKLLHSSLLERKQEANTFFKKKQYADALKLYEEVMTELSKLVPSQVHTTALAEEVEIQVICLIKMSKCHLYLKHYKEAADHCSMALKLEPENYQAHYLRGRALFKLRDLAASKEDLLIALTHVGTKSTSRSHQIIKTILQEIERQNPELKQNTYPDVEEIDTPLDDFEEYDEEDATTATDEELGANLDGEYDSDTRAGEETDSGRSSPLLATKPQNIHSPRVIHPVKRAVRNPLLWISVTAVLLVFLILVYVIKKTLYS